jgi:hypothetical protein
MNPIPIDLQHPNLALQSRHRVMKEIAYYRLEHAIDVQVSCTFAWNWRTDIRNWDDPPAEFRLDGPFAEGTWGTTLLPGASCSAARSSRLPIPR